jgi:hypothetical protein
MHDISLTKLILVSCLPFLLGTFFGLSLLQGFSHSDHLFVYPVWLSVLPMFLVFPLLEDSPLVWPAFFVAQFVYYLALTSATMWLWSVRGGRRRLTSLEVTDEK